jgi:hypothetical protein
VKRIAEFVSRDLQWKQPSAMKREFDLVCGDETLATLQFRSMFGSLAVARAAEGSWSFKRVGFWAPRVTVRVADQEAEIAVFQNNTWKAGGSLVMPDGRRFHANSNFWQTSYEFKNESEESLVRFVRVRGAFHLSSNVEITPAGGRLPELPWLVALGWYLVVKMVDDSSGAAAGGAGAAAAAG